MLDAGHWILDPDHLHKPSQLSLIASFQLPIRVRVLKTVACAQLYDPPHWLSNGELWLVYRWTQATATLPAKTTRSKRDLRPASQVAYVRKRRTISTCTNQYSKTVPLLVLLLNIFCMMLYEVFDSMG
jgi:hypothetical protein